jgi:DNA-binding IclR family transcriptional regulator
MAKSDVLEPPESPSILLKAYELLTAFSHRRRVMTLSDLARASGLPKSTVHRILARLLEIGAVERHGDAYRIGMSLFAVASCSPASALRDVAAPHLEDLHSRTRQTIHLGVLRGSDVFYLEKLRHLGSIRTPTFVGGRLPAHCTAIGKALLAAEDQNDLAELLTGPLTARTARSITDPQRLRAEFKEIRVAGLATDDEEAAPGLACVAVPIPLGDRAIGGISVSFPAAAGAGQVLRNALRETAARISRSLDAHDAWIPPARLSW